MKLLTYIDKYDNITDGRCMGSYKGGKVYGILYGRGGVCDPKMKGVYEIL